jgi:DNA-binding SARP family transcriptional activator
MPDALRIGVLGPLQVRDGAGHSVPIGGRQLRVLLILLALDAGRVVSVGSLAGQLWPGDPPGTPATRCRRWSPGCGPNCAGPGLAR